MQEKKSSLFVDALAEQLSKAPALVEVVAQLVAQRLSQSNLARGATPPAARAPAFPKGATAKAQPAKTAKKTSGKKVVSSKKGPAPAGGASVESVLAAIRSGASTRAEVIAHAAVSVPTYKYALGELKKKGLVRVEGSRATAKLVAV